MKNTLFLILILLCSCSKNSKREYQKKVKKLDSLVLEQSFKNVEILKLIEKRDSLLIKKEVRKILFAKNDDEFVNIKLLSDNFSYDLKYATNDNFLKQTVYDCAECYVRLKTAKALLKANNQLRKKGFKIKFFDCYRPYSVQQKMWKIFPNPYYLANPKKGSIHNKGGAVDITLVTLDNVELDMGTKFDHFGKEAHQNYLDLPKEILSNRKLLRETMQQNGFWTIRTEWWHYNYSKASNDKISDFKWNCN